MKAIKEDEIETEIMKSSDFTETEKVLVDIDKFLKENTQRSCTTEGPKFMVHPLVYLTTQKIKLSFLKWK